MNKNSYLNRIATARSKMSTRTSQDAYAQVDRMAKSTNGRFTTKVSAVSSHGPSTAVASIIIPIDAIPCRLHEKARSILGGGI
jgi:hypothetical protein